MGHVFISICSSHHHSQSFELSFFSSLSSRKSLFIPQTGTYTHWHIVLANNTKLFLQHTHAIGWQLNKFRVLVCMKSRRRKFAISDHVSHIPIPLRERKIILPASCSSLLPPRIYGSYHCWLEACSFRFPELNRKCSTTTKPQKLCQTYNLQQKSPPRLLELSSSTPHKRPYILGDKPKAIDIAGEGNWEAKDPIRSAPF